MVMGFLSERLCSCCGGSIGLLLQKRREKMLACLAGRSRERRELAHVHTLHQHDYKTKE